MVCETCGCNNEDASLYCANCGAKLDTISKNSNSNIIRRTAFMYRKVLTVIKRKSLAVPIPRTAVMARGEQILRIMHILRTA